MFTPNTGNDKLDRAYNNLSMHISAYNNFEEFYNYFQRIVKTDDKDVLNKWLLKVLFVQMKYNKHPFDELTELVNNENAAKLKDWLDNELKKVRQTK
ncbi:hypothetical protein CP985_05700 [Malaciobacter mytili LMG 24559]|uniref:Uncharacterized protein n=1 Tax=Malaciobacter mytili LMG 24559 TaxID=1032238 RepID=A0AAX2AJ61_9BACT|nr:hypothetical protein [Malaciobacter mytili]AXH14356.1 hypothetical protein AMYT_0763 [Malaciobacter mytili LMG 24559]RXK16068.1 hypothetical protein CP985_05700 [Malaciobacter mytili LMG 24559]